MTDYCHFWEISYSLESDFTLCSWYITSSSTQAHYFCVVFCYFFLGNMLKGRCGSYIRSSWFHEFESLVIEGSFLKISLSFSSDKTIPHSEFSHIFLFVIERCYYHFTSSRLGRNTWLEYSEKGKWLLMLPNIVHASSSFLLLLIFPLKLLFWNALYHYWLRDNKQK